MPTSTSTIRCKKGATLGSVVVPGSDEIELLTPSQSGATTVQVPRLPSDRWLERYHQVRNQTMDLVATLTPEDQMVQSMPDASPAKWHLAHTTWFFETFVLAPHVTGYLPYDERYGFLFNSYYKRLGPHPSRTTRGTFSRPTLDEVWSYRTHVDNIIRDLLDRGASPEVFRLLELGLNHEQQHQELIITDIKHAFWVNPVRPSYQPGQSETPWLCRACFYAPTGLVLLRWRSSIILAMTGPASLSITNCRGIPFSLSLFVLPPVS